MQQGIQLLRLHHHHGFLFGNHALIHHITGDFQCRCSRTFTVTCLQHEQISLFNGKFHILHILIMTFQCCTDFCKFLISSRRDFLQLIDGLRGTDTCNDILALCIHQEFTIQLVFTGTWITRKGNAGTAVISHVAENHHLYVDSCSPVSRNIIHFTIENRTLVVPGTENCFNRAVQLLFRIGWEIFLQGILIEFLKALHHFLHVVRIQISILLYAFFLLHFINNVFKLRFVQSHDNISKHLDETTVGIICKPRIIRQSGNALHNLIVESQI